MKGLIIRHRQILSIQDSRIGLGLDNNFKDTNLQVRYGATTHADTTVALSQDTVYMMLFKLDYSASGQLTEMKLWVNPGDLTSEALSGAATLTYSGTISQINRTSNKS